jgi:K+-transporting ATPase KdpF subunit
MPTSPIEPREPLFWSPAMFEAFVGIVAVGLLVYLFATLLMPEKF